MNTYMKRAVELAIQNVKEGGQPFGAVLEKDGKIIGEGVNELHRVHDSSGHAELLAIRKAQQELQTLDLSGATMYASGHPCPMCYAVMRLAGIDQVYYYNDLPELEAVGLRLGADIYKELKTERPEWPIHFESLQEGIEDPLDSIN